MIGDLKSAAESKNMNFGVSADNLKRLVRIIFASILGVLICLAVFFPFSNQAQAAGSASGYAFDLSGSGGGTGGTLTPVTGGYTSTPIAFGIPVNAEFTSTSPKHSDGSYYTLYSFQAESGQLIKISMSSSAFDPYLELWDSPDPVTAHILAKDRGYASSDPAILPAAGGYYTCPSTGTYYILANTFSSGASGAYSLNLSASSLAGVTITFSAVSGSGAVPGTVTTDTSGRWSQTGFAAGTTYRATPSLTTAKGAAYVFNPSYLEFGADQDAGNINFYGCSPTMAMTSPTAGQALNAGDTWNIAWTYRGNIGDTVMILLYKGSTVLDTRTAVPVGTNGAGSYQWVSSASLEAGSDYLMVVASELDPDIHPNNRFTVVPASLTLTSPAGGEKWGVGQNPAITWTYVGNSAATLKIELIKADPAAATTIAEAADISLGSYSWNIPTTGITAGSDYTIRLTRSDTGQTVSSASYFSILDATYQAGGTVSMITFDAEHNTAIPEDEHDVWTTRTHENIALGQTVTVTDLGNRSTDDIYNDKAVYGRFYAFKAFRGQQIYLKDISDSLPSGADVAIVRESRVLAWEGSGCLAISHSVSVRFPGSEYITIDETGEYFVYFGNPFSTTPKTLDAQHQSFKFTLCAAPINEASLNFTEQSGEGAPAAVATDAQGNWTQTFSSAGNYRVTPEKEGYVFSPSYIDITTATSGCNFSGTTTGLELLSPAADANWKLGTEYTISWGYWGAPGKQVKLTLLKDNVVISELATVAIGTLGYGSCKWTPSSALTAGSGYTIRIESTTTSWSDSVNFNLSGFTVSGTITEGGAGLANVSINLSSDGTGVLKSTTTAADGRWSLSDLSGYTSYRVTPVLAASDFDPAYLDFTGPRTDLNFTTGFTVSGTVKNGETGLAGITIKLTNTGSAATASTVTDQQGVWSFSRLISGPTYRVTPENILYAFTPAYLEFQGARTDLNFSSASPSVTSPAAGGTWRFPGSYSINWSYNGPAGKTAKIELLKNDAAVRTIADSASNVSMGANGSGTYTWTLPIDLEAGSDYRIRVSCIENSSQYTVTSGAFSIAKDLSVTLEKTTWLPTTVGIIYWYQDEGHSSNWEIVLLKNSVEIGQPFQVAQNTNRGMVEWALPQTVIPGNDYQIRVKSLTYPGLYADSGYFTVPESFPASGYVVKGYDGPVSSLTSAGTTTGAVYIPIALGQTVEGSLNASDYVRLDGGGISRFEDCYQIVLDTETPIAIDVWGDHLIADLTVYCDSTNPASDSKGSAEYFSILGTAECSDGHLRTPASGFLTLKSLDSFGHLQPGSYTIKVRSGSETNYRFRVSTPVADANVSFAVRQGDVKAPHAVVTNTQGAWSQSFAAGGIYQATASKYGSSMTPDSMEISSANKFVDFNAITQGTAHPAITDIVLDNAEGTFGQDQTVNATIHGNNAPDGTPVAVSLLTKAGSNPVSMESPGRVYRIAANGVISNGQAVIPLVIGDMGYGVYVPAGEYQVRAMIAGSASTASADYAVKSTDPIVPAITEISLSADHQIAGQGQELTIAVQTANVSDGTVVNFSLLDKWGNQATCPSTYGISMKITLPSGTIVNNQAQISKMLPSLIPAGNYRVHVEVKTSASIYGEKAYAVVGGDKLITAFSVPGQAGQAIIDVPNRAVTFHMPFGTAVTSLIPTIEVSNGAALSPLSGIAQNFSNPLIYTVTAGDQSTQEWTVTCIVDPLYSSAKEITLFTVPEQVGTTDINAMTNTVIFHVPYGTNVSALVPAINVSAAASINPLSGVAQDFTSQVAYVVTAQDGSIRNWTAVCIVDAQMSNAKDITGFSVAGQSGESAIDSVNKTVVFHMPYGSAINALIPTITVSDKAAILPLSGLAQDFSTPVVYTVTAENGSSQQWTVSCIVDALLSEAKDITAFSVPVQIGSASINNVAHTVRFHVPYGTNVSSLIPTITVSANAVISPASGIAQDFTNTVSYTVTAQNLSTCIWTITGIVDPEGSSATEITSFSVAGQVGPSIMNTTLHTATFHMPYGSNVTQLSPTITVSENATIDPASGVVRDFSNQVSYNVTGQDRFTQEWLITCIVDNEDTAPVVIETDPADGASGVALSSSITITFSEEIQPGKNLDFITLNNGSTSMGYTVRVEGDTLNIGPSNAFKYGQEYNLKIPAGAVEDLIGNQLEQPFTMSFKTLDPAADLTIATLSPSMLRVTPGVRFNVSYTVKNQGQASARMCLLKFYVVGDVAEEPSAEQCIGQASIYSLMPGRSYYNRAYLTIPVNFSGEARYLVGIVDTDDVVTELDETNNSRSISLGIVTPDLTFVNGSISVQRSTGGSLTIRDTVLNAGQGASKTTTTITYYLWNGEDLLSKIRVGQRSITTLRSGARSTGFTALRIPAALEPGTWYIQAIIDEGNRIKEFSGENNNVSPDIPLS